MNRPFWLQNESFKIAGNRLFFAGYPIEKIVQENDTPLYLYDLEKVKNNYEKVVSKISKYAPLGYDSRVYYAMKANGAKEILRQIHGSDGWIDTSSIGELKKALGTGFNPKKIIFTATNFGLTEFEFLCKSGVLINIDSFSQLERIREYAPMDISIRFNPGIEGVGFNKKYEMSGVDIKGSRLGIHSDRIIEAYEKARFYGLNPIMFHQHIGSNWLTIEDLPKCLHAVRKATEIIYELENRNFSIQVLNLGGGIGVRSHEKYPEFPLDSFMTSIWEIVLSSKIKIKTLAIEPGRYIAGNSGVLLAKVNMNETKNGINYIGVDAGFNMYHHKFMYDIDNTIINVTRFGEAPNHKYAVCGYLGEQGDIFSELEMLPETKEGDVIMFYPAGAYCASELAVHHHLPSPREFFI